MDVFPASKARELAANAQVLKANVKLANRLIEEAAMTGKTETTVRTTYGHYISLMRVLEEAGYATVCTDVAFERLWRDNDEVDVHVVWEL